MRLKLLDSQSQWSHLYLYCFIQYRCFQSSFIVINRKITKSLMQTLAMKQIQNLLQSNSKKLSLLCHYAIKVSSVLIQWNSITVWSSSGKKWVQFKDKQCYRRHQIKHKPAQCGFEAVQQHCQCCKIHQVWKEIDSDDIFTIQLNSLPIVFSSDSVSVVKFIILFNFMCLLTRPFM